MTSYWKPRWPCFVLFGSYRELNYRLEIGGKEDSFYRIRTGAGPGFHLSLCRSDSPPGFIPVGEVDPLARGLWLDEGSCLDSLSGLFQLHFSLIEVSPPSFLLHGDPTGSDLFPEGRQLGWCLSLVYSLWTAVPEDRRMRMLRSEFIG